MAEAVVDDCQMPGCLFVDVDDLPSNVYGMLQLLFLMGCYAYVLGIGADMIGDGAEEMLKLDAWAPIVGPIVLPVLGAVPDAAIVFFSGIGPGAQAQLSVGIGALAGSTVMLLTVPWALSIKGGLVAYDSTLITGGTTAQSLVEAAYDKKKKIRMKTKGMGKGASLGVAPDEEKLWSSAMIMAITLIGYLIIQAPAWSISGDTTVVPIKTEPIWSMLGMIATVILLVGNLVFQYNSKDKDTVAHLKLAALKAEVAGELGITAAFGAAAKELGAAVMKLKPENFKRAGDKTSDEFRWMGDKPSDKEQWHQYSKAINAKDEDHKFKHKEVYNYLLETFHKYDTDHGGDISASELHEMLKADFGTGGEALAKLFEPDNPKNAIETYDRYKGDSPKSVKTLTFWEFVGVVIDLANRDEYLEDLSSGDGVKDLYTNPFFPDRTENCMIMEKTIKKVKDLDGDSKRILNTPRESHDASSDLEAADDDDDEEEDGDESDEGEEEIWVRSSHENDLLRGSFKQMAIGTMLVLLFSDPMVACLSDLATRTGIPVFFVSFLLAPLASNASELSSSMKMAEGKDKKSITAALQQCIGACIMNNTMGLFVFAALIYFQGLEWEYTSETLCTMVPQLLVLPFVALKVHNMKHAYCVASLYPLCLGIFMILEYGLKLN